MRKLTILVMGAALLALAISPVAGTQDEAMKIFNDNDCADCHNVSAVGIGELPAVAEAEDDGWDDGWDDDEAGPPDLSNVGAVADAEWISKWLKKKIDLAGNKHPERFEGSDEDLATLTLWLQSLKYELPEGVGVPAQPQEKKGKKDKKDEKKDK